jgi:hypothetical protein
MDISNFTYIYFTVRFKFIQVFNITTNELQSILRNAAVTKYTIAQNAEDIFLDINETLV